MRKINYKSDFKELVTLSGTGCVGVPFRFTYHCGSSCQPFVAYWDGEKYLNCRKLDENHILVIFDRGTHSLGVGKLMCKREFFLNDSDYFDGICNYVSEECCETELTNGKTECDDFTIASNVIVNAIRGGSCLTDEEKAFLMSCAESFNALSLAVDSEKNILFLGGKQYQLVEYIPEPEITYSDIEISLSYDDIESEGGEVEPKLEYKQVKKITYPDGTFEEEEITDGAEVSFSVEDGVVRAGASIVAQRHKIEDVTVTVLLNGIEGSATTGVYQKPYIETVVYHVGAVNATKSVFAGLSAEQLDTASEERRSAGTGLFSAIASCFFMLIPAGLEVIKCSYTSGGMTTDILGNDAWNLEHEDVEIAGKTYKVYGYRNGGVTPSEPQIYDYSIKKV